MERNRMRRQRGVSLIELMIYVCIAIILAATIVGSIVAMQNASQGVTSEQAVESAAETSLGTIARDIRNAYAIDATNSTFNANPGQLTIDTENQSGATSSITFFVSGQAVHTKEGATDEGPLSSPNARVTNLVFRNITTSNSEAVKIEMTVESGSASTTSYVSRQFETTAVLRGSYDQ